jgi:hypothetical protein
MDDLIKVAIAICIVAGFPILLYAGFVGIRAHQRRIEARYPGSPAMEDLDELRARVSELEQVQARLEELEERMDFSERLLAKQNRVSQLPGEME